MIQENVERVQERIAQTCRRAGRPEKNITLVAVSKTFRPEKIREAHACGLLHFAENRVQEAEGKIRQLKDLEIIWHMVGHLQGNKAKTAAEIFHTIQSVDSLRLARKLNEVQAKRGASLPILVQVDPGKETTKSGVRESELLTLIDQMSELPHLRVLGLMTLPPFFEEAEQVRPYFRRLRKLAESVSGRNWPNVSIEELSMGMSHDFEVAIEEGATLVRVGTAIFGPRARP